MSRLSSTLDQPAITHKLPALWEVLRAVSGLVAIVTLLVIMAGVALRTDSGRAVTVQPVPEVQETDTTLDSLASASAPSPPWTFVLYVVETVDQVQIAEWGKDFAQIATPDRSYRMVSTDVALDFAVQAAVQESLRSGQPVQLQVIDLRHMSH